jgi:CDP-diacylglycerol--glycerol-3-phosphate 3-phosphatidyltransferase
MTLYDLKPRFQDLLRPFVRFLATNGVVANHVTVFAALLSLGVGAAVAINAESRVWFLAIPVWLFLRMAFNAIDGMLAGEFGQKTPLGAYLNELTDVVSDAALYLPFAFIPPFSFLSVGTVIFFAALSEFAGALGPMVGASRQYAGPLGKSDRAFVFGALGLCIGTGFVLPLIFVWMMPLLVLLLIITMVNRIRSGVRNAAVAQQSFPS